MYITFTSAKVQIRLITLALKPRGEITKTSEQGYQRPQKWTCVHQILRKESHIRTDSKNQLLNYVDLFIGSAIQTLRRIREWRYTKEYFDSFFFYPRRSSMNSNVLANCPDVEPKYNET